LPYFKRLRDLKKGDVFVWVQQFYSGGGMFGGHTSVFLTVGEMLSDPLIHEGWYGIAGCKFLARTKCLSRDEEAEGEWTEPREFDLHANLDVVPIESHGRNFKRNLSCDTSENTPSTEKK
jgi:hypothetical protein